MAMDNIVLYPSPGMGHLIALVELGKFILRRNPSISITVLTLQPSVMTGTAAAYVKHISATVPSIAFHHLPPISLDIHSFPTIEAFIFELLRRCNPHVRTALQTIPNISAIIFDFFCTCAHPIANELQIPTYYFMTSGACCLAFFLYLPHLNETVTDSFRNMHNQLQIPGFPPIIPSADMVRPLLDRDSTDYRDFLYMARNVRNSDGILINSFESLEIKPLKTIREGKCNPGVNTPTIYCVGPLLAANDNHGGGEHECLLWLNSQPSKSVVFLCFGSLGSFTAPQLKEIAIGLEKSGVRFLWVVRSPPTEDPKQKHLPPPPPDLDILLPAGFIERTKERGLVVKSWAPQIAVLNHGAVGGFVTHCGWNSVLEAVTAGVGMVAWPLYAEQHLNRVILAEEMKLVIRMKEGENAFVAADEVERGVREVIDPESEVRKMVEQRSLEAKAAMEEGGSSVVAMEKLLKLWKSAK